MSLNHQADHYKIIMQYKGLCEAVIGDTVEGCDLIAETRLWDASP